MTENIKMIVVKIFSTTANTNKKFSTKIVEIFFFAAPSGD